MFAICSGLHLRKLYAPLLLILLLSVSLAQTTGWTATRRGQKGKDLNAVYFADTKRGWIAGDNGLLSRTKDGGRTWSSHAAGVTEAINDIYFRGKDDGYLLSGSRIYGTSDGGEAWRELREFQRRDFEGATPELYSIRFSGKKNGW